MTTLATHTAPVLVSTDESGLGKYEYEITGKLVTSKTPCTTFRKCFKDAMQQAKETVANFIARLEIGGHPLTEVNIKKSGWIGIHWRCNSWCVTGSLNNKTIYLGSHKDKAGAINIKKRFNLRNGRDEFHGMKKLNIHN